MNVGFDVADVLTGGDVGEVEGSGSGALVHPATLKEVEHDVGEVFGSGSR